MRRLIAIVALVLVAACAAVSGTPGADPGGRLYVLPPGPAPERAQASELAVDLYGGLFGIPHP